MFEEIANDTRRGASVLTRLAAHELARMAESSEARDSGAFWDELIAACGELVLAQREMASILNLAGRVLRSAERAVLSGLSHEVVRHAVLIECKLAVEMTDSSLECLGKEGADLVPDDGTVATLSASESVRAVLAEAAGRGKAFNVIVSESRPGGEGVEFAKSLASLNVPSILVADAALPEHVGRSSLVLVGADSVSEADFVNKIGTLPLALAARERDVPLYVATLLNKLIPSALRGEPDRLRDPAEILEDRPTGVAVENRYFEIVPSDLVRGFVTEEGILVPAKLALRPTAPALLTLLFPRNWEAPEEARAGS